MREVLSTPRSWLCVAGAIVLAGSVFGAPFTNGGFEVASITPPSGSWSNLSGGATDITGWTVRAANIDYINAYWAAADGTRSLDLSGQGAGGIEQTFDTEPGVRYSVAFYLAGNPGCGSTVKGLDVGATGNPTVHYTFDVTGHSTSSMGWRRELYSFIATGSTTTLFFQSTENSDCGPALDAVSVAELAVPALSPTLAAALALLLAVIGLLVLGRRLTA